MNTIGKDKAKHIAVSFLLCLLFGYYNTLFGVIFTFAIGIGKEVWDKESGKGTPDVYDILANFIGILLATGLLIIGG